MNINDNNVLDLKEKFEIAKKKQILCTFEKCFPQHNSQGGYIQIVLNVISEEADIILKYCGFDVFADNSKDAVCYIQGKYFDRFLQDCDRYDDLKNNWLSLDEEKEVYEQFLRDKLILINPFFFINTESHNPKFFKNGKIIDVYNIDSNSNSDLNYFTIPILHSSVELDKIKKGDPFILPDVSKSIMGIPSYIYYDSKVYLVNVDAVEDNDCYWTVVGDSENSFVELNLNINDLNETEIVQDKYCNFVFIKKDKLINSNEVKVVHSNIDKDKEETAIEEYSEIGEILNDFYDYTKSQKLSYQRNDLYNYHTCVMASQLIILAGMSGTGKTRLPLTYAKYFGMSEENDTLLFVPVSPSFTEPADLLGFLNPNTGIYTSSETRLVEFLINASKNPEKMHMIIFDEMNLAQIEFWFAPFISILEKDVDDRTLHLYSSSQRCINDEKYPASLKIGRNIIFIGTINLDETTKNVSDRLLDRSYIINLKKEKFSNYKAEQSRELDEEGVKSFEGDFYELMKKASHDSNYINKFDLKSLAFFDELHDNLSDIDPQKGVSFRSIKNISLFLSNIPKELSPKLAFDYAVKQTIMKKINGSIENIGEFIGQLNEDGNPIGKLNDIFEKYNEISDFTECKKEMKNKIIELKKYGYTR